MPFYLPIKSADSDAPDERMGDTQYACRSQNQERELQRVNRRLVEESERLRLALAETDSLRQREAAVLRERTILFDSLKVLSNASSSSAALHALLINLRSIYQARPVCLLAATGNEVKVHASTDDALLGLEVPIVTGALCQSRRMASLQPLGISDCLPDVFQCLRSLLIVPLPLAGVSDQCALLLGAGNSGHFSASDLKVVERISTLAHPVLIGLHQT